MNTNNHEWIPIRSKQNYRAVKLDVQGHIAIVNRRVTT